MSAGVMLLCARAGEAQTAQRVSIQASGLFVRLLGDVYQGIKNGPGAEAQIRYNPSAFSIGGGVQWSHHSFGEDWQAAFGNGSSTATGVFLEPRYVLPVTSNVLGPYISSRLAYIHQSFDLPAFPSVTASSNGVQVNFGGGVLLRASSNVNIDLGLTYGFDHFDSINVSSGSQRASEPLGNASNFVFRVGLAVGLGK